MPEKPQEQQPQGAVNGGGDREPVNGSGGANKDNDNEIADQVRRQEDLSLTDHLNRRLLTSFLARINNAGAQEQDAAAAPRTEADQDGDDFAV